MLRIYLGGHLRYYHPQKAKWLEVEIDQPTLMEALLEEAGIPLGEAHLLIVNGEAVELKNAIVTAQDEVKIYSAVGGG